MKGVRSQPCFACPYRRDVPSGVWSAEEYDKLAEYDAPTVEQPVSFFGCHATPDHVCHGWAVVHGKQTDDRACMGLRLLEILFGPVTVPEAGVPLFNSGAEAAEHGKRDIARPSKAAKAAAARLMRKYARLREG